ncbi:Pfmc-2TM Maurer's cleft two transmembrane protein [Plasmodium reichenowi]|uniref:Pfmc-2TM Maurer's cleft two transmembrane protein n=1 Tax=Plasmodium reichenowi TaxID=5854 RepID=A0A2P9DT50_PLARE|nr:Pfmc-2TM Maurer's cleft two transmembrane protein [Plasmodium reichenowi]
MFRYFLKICIFTIILLYESNLFNNNVVEIGTYTLSYHNGRIQFRMLAQKNTNKKSYGTQLTHLLLKDKNLKDKKKKNLDPQISALINLVDNMNVTQEEKDKIKTLTLKYIDSDDIKKKNKSINELKKYSNNQECKEHMDNYLMHLRMQNDIKYLKRKNLWNNIWIISITLLSIIILIATMAMHNFIGFSAFLMTYILSNLMIYILARFFPEIKLRFKELKETCTNFFKKKSK